MQIFGCENSALFTAFSEHILHRLQIKQNTIEHAKKVRITFLSRGTKYRKVLNEYELINRISSSDEYAVKRVNFGRHVSFKGKFLLKSWLKCFKNIIFTNH